MNIYFAFFKLIQKQNIDVKDILSIMDLSVKKTNNGERVTTPLHHVKTAVVCKELIMKGACVDARDPEGRTPLHNAILYRRGLEVVRELLKFGANVNIADDYKCTPLIVAIQLLGKEAFETVKELLQFGANPNVHDYQGYSALTLALYKKDLNIIKEMLEWGADINFRNKTPIHYFLMFLTPMTEAVHGDQACAKLLIKMTVMNYYDNDFKKIIDLNRFSNVKNFKELSSFLEECAVEVHGMKSFRVNNKNSLLEFVASSRKLYIKPLHCNDDIIRGIPTVFPIYQDIILTNIQPHLLRAQLLGKLRDLKLYIATYNVYRGKKNYFNADCTCKIAEYLNNSELSAFIEAYDI